MPSQSRPFRVGLIGAGYAGSTFHVPLIRAVDGLELSAVSTRAPEKVRAILPDVVIHADPLVLVKADGLDLIVIASPNASHAPLARAAMKAGKAVVVDKPFTLDLVEARDLIAVADETGQLLSVFHNRRWDSDFLSVSQAIQTGDIGRVTHFESHFDRFRPVVRDRWREQTGPGSGVWFDLGPHLVDQALMLFGLPDRVQGNLARQRQGAQTDDWAHAVLIYGETRVILQASMLAAGGTPRFVVHGDKGSLIKHGGDRQEAQLLDGMRPGDPGWGDDPDPVILYGPNGDVRSLKAQIGDQRAYYRGIGAALSDHDSNPVAPIEALAVTAVIEAVAHSAQVGRGVEIQMNEIERQGWIDWQTRRRPGEGRQSD